MVRHDELHISIHALREEGDLGVQGFLKPFQISIHALREEGDAPDFFCPNRPVTFLSTPSARRATRHRLVRQHGGADISIHALREEGDGVEEVLQPFALISIHALREEGDDCEDACVALIGYFYPRPP